VCVCVCVCVYLCVCVCVYSFMCVKNPIPMSRKQVPWRIHAWWLIHTCAMCHGYYNAAAHTHDTVICVTLLIYMCAMTATALDRTNIIDSYVCHDSFICVPWLFHTCAVTHSYVRHACYNARASFICVPANITHSYVWHDSFIHVPWLSHMCAMTESTLKQANSAEPPSQ